MNKKHYTNQGIHANRQFSVNLPSVDQMVETDYVGIVTGKNTDKSKLFEIFYGELPAAPLISACPVNMECRLHSVVDFPTHDVFIGEIVATHADEEVLKNGGIDLTAVNPLLFDMSSAGYFKLGERVGDAWRVGKNAERKIKDRLK